MLFHCTKEDCRFWGEGEVLPDACPRCGGALTVGDREKMTGDDWCALGVFWIEQDGAEEKAVSCFRRSAQLGSGWGACNLGLCLEQGTGVEADPRQALWLYQQAAEMGSLPALCNLAVCYEEGIGTPPDPRQAVALYRRAAEYGSTRAQRLLARCCDRGIGMDRRDPARRWSGCAWRPFRGICPADLLASTTSSATGWSRTRSCRCAGTARAAEGDEPEAKCCLGWLMEQGKWVDRDPEGAVGALPPGGRSRFRARPDAFGRLSARRRRDPGRPGAGGPLL